MITSSILLGVVGGPLLGLFTLGVIFRRVEQRGAVAGFIRSVMMMMMIMMIIMIISVVSALSPGSGLEGPSRPAPSCRSAWPTAAWVETRPWI